MNKMKILYLNLWRAVNTSLRRKYSALTAHIRKEERIKIKEEMSNIRNQKQTISPQKVKKKR